MKLAAREHRKGLRNHRVGRSHVHVGIARSEPTQENGKDPFEEVRRRRHTQHADIPPSERLRVLAQSVRIGENPLAIAQQLLAVARQQQPAPHAIEQLDAEVILELGDLSRERGLRDMQPQRRFRSRRRPTGGHVAPPPLDDG